MGDRCAKEGQHGVAGVLFHRATVALDLPAHGREVLGLDVAHVLGIERLGQGGEPHQIAEKDRHQAPLFLRWCSGSDGRGLGEGRGHSRKHPRGDGPDVPVDAVSGRSDLTSL